MFPLDISLFGPLRNYYNQETSNGCPGRTATQYQVAPLFTEAYGKEASMKNAISGNKNTGIHPLDEDIFPDHLFPPSLSIDVPQQQTAETQNEDENIHP